MGDIKKMKIKELRQFLKDREVRCDGCVEKSDFIAKALTVKDKKIDADLEEARSVDLKTPIEKQWREIAKEICLKKGCSEALAKKLSKAVELSFDQYARVYRRELTVTNDKMIQVSFKHPFHTYGRLVITRTVKWALSQSEPTSTKIRENFEPDFKPWLRDVALEQPNE